MAERLPYLPWLKVLLVQENLAQLLGHCSHQIHEWLAISYVSAGRGADDVSSWCYATLQRQLLF